MKKFFFISLFFLQTLLYGCATCQLMIPSAEIRIDLQVEQKTLQSVKFAWHFSDIYSESIVRQYDKNKNGVLEKKELKAVLDAMLDYLTKKEMLTTISYSNAGEEGKKIKAKYENFDLKMPDKFLIFTYDTSLHEELKEQTGISFAFEDDEGYFGFVVLGLQVNGASLSYEENLYLFTASLLFSEKVSFKSPQIQMQSKQQNVEANKTNYADENKSQETKNKSSLEENILQESIAKIKSLFEAIKDEKNPLSYLFLLFFAYVYGLVHALGPGHGKTLVASYFLANERSYSKALFVSLAIGVVHTFSAFLLTLFIYYVVNTFLAQFLEDTLFYTTKISALIIIAIALFLLMKRYNAYKQREQLTKAPSYKFSATPHIASCGCGSCKLDNNATDMALIISAGIIPCPGTTTIFIFAISLGLYYAGFVSALVMSMGMSTIIFFSALLSVALRKKTRSNSGNLKKYLEYLSLGFILILGFVLLFA